MIQGESYNIFMNSLGSHIIQSIGFITSDNGYNQFSGTFISHLDKKYLVTAKHCIKDIIDFDTLVICTEKNASGIIYPKPRLAYLEDVDIGRIEIPDEMFASLKCTSIPSAIVNNNSPCRGKDVFIMGFPSSEVKKEENTYYPTPFFYRSKVSERWPKGTNEFEYFRPEKHFFIEWDHNNTIDLKKNKIKTFPLQGISGCGVFTIIPPAKDSIVWDFTQLEFTGVISSVNRQVGLIQSVKSEHVLRLWDN